MKHNTPLVYLSGPMAGLKLEDAVNGWRKKAAEMLKKHEIIGINPGRGKADQIPNTITLDKLGFDHCLRTSSRGLTVRDYYDIKRSEFLLCNLLSAKDVGIGSMIELGWAYALNVPIVLVIENEGNIHDHALVDSIASVRTPYFDEAISYIIHCIELDCMYY